MLISEGPSKDRDWSSLSLKDTHRDIQLMYPDRQQWWFNTNHYLQRARQLGDLIDQPPFPPGLSSIYSPLGRQGDAIWLLKQRAIDGLGRPHIHIHMGPVRPSPLIRRGGKRRGEETNPSSLGSSSHHFQNWHCGSFPVAKHCLM